MVPRAEQHDQLVLDCRISLGHLREKRTTAVHEKTHWWYGMVAVVKHVLPGCKSCHHLHASGGHEWREMQTKPTGDFGIFHIWGMGYIADLPVNQLVNKHALVCIDHF